MLKRQAISGKVAGVTSRKHIIEVSWSRAVPCPSKPLNGDRPAIEPNTVIATDSCTCTCRACEYQFEFSANAAALLLHVGWTLHDTGSSANSLSIFCLNRKGIVTKIHAGTPPNTSTPDPPRTLPISDEEAPLVWCTDFGKKDTQGHCVEASCRP